MKQRRDQRTVLIVSLLVISLIMVAGFAAFATNLTINGTSNIATSWNIQITNIRGVYDKSVTNNGAYEVTAPTITNNNLNANFHTGLISPGDTRIYEVEVSNLGSVDAEVTKTLTNNTTSEAIEISYLGVAPVGTQNTAILANDGTFNGNGLITSEPFNLPANTNNVRYLYIKVKYKDSVTSQPSSLSSSITLELNAVQSTGSHEETSIPSTYSGTIYAWNTNTITVGTSTINDLASTKTLQPYYTSVAGVMSASGYPFFNKYTVENDTITEGYVCQTFGISGLEPVCLKMCTDGSEYGYDAGGNHSGNAGILKALQSNSKFTGSCYFDARNSGCNAAGLDVAADSDGDVYSFDGSAGCIVDHDGTATCYE